MQIIKLIVIFFAFSISSVLVTLFAYYIMSIPNIIEFPVSLSFETNNNETNINNQFASLYFNCTTNKKDNCSNIGDLNYQVLFEFEVVKNEHSMDSSNFEINMNYLMNMELNTAKKINFIEKYDYYIEAFFKIVYFPLNILGYKKTETIVMTMINKLDNRMFELDYLDVVIKNNKLNIKNAKIIFIPVVGYIRNLLWSFRALTLPAIFFGFIFIQMSLYLLIKFLTMMYEKFSSN